jgi:RecG-like helicase
MPGYFPLKQRQVICIVRAMLPTENKVSSPVNPASREETIPPLQQPVSSLWGVGQERAAQLARLEIFTIEDLLLYPPRRYEDRRHFKKISELVKGEPATARGNIVALGLKRFRGGSRSVFEIILDDGSARLHCRWWNLPFMQNYFAQGDEVFVFGKPIEIKPRTMDHPETEVIEGGEESFIHIARIAPVYSLTEGLPQRWLRGLIWRTLEKFEAQLDAPQAGRPKIPAAPTDTVLPSRGNAVRNFRTWRLPGGGWRSMSFWISKFKSNRAGKNLRQT